MTVPATKLERRQRDELNRYRKLTVGQERIWTLGRIAMMSEVDADNADGSGWDKNGLRADALFLRRLAWDLEAQHDAVHGRRPSLDPQGPRP